jgi:hypothetical protein
MLAGWLGPVPGFRLSLASCLACLMCFSVVAVVQRSYQPQAWLV